MYFLDFADIDVDGEDNTEEETEYDSDARTAPSTSTASLSVLEAVTNAILMNEPLRPTTSAPVSAVDKLLNVSEYYRKHLPRIFFKKHIIWNSFHRRTWNRLYSFAQCQKGEAIALEFHLAGEL
ncbi:hypothetical protein PoB_006687500 [Plakobranchus ocellatus]|uniref:Uncharacterized protein n=1 Tax=Plakobranchus ocellatus TaxID=259542 RepID=A0AAV4D8I8_9GAST|nr:hypothetical protein PoB_006687500 [Plakobranchus ocellatus]